MLFDFVVDIIEQLFQALCRFCITDSSKGAAEVELIPAGMVLVNSNVFDILGYGFFGEALRSVFDPHSPGLLFVATLSFPYLNT